MASGKTLGKSILLFILLIILVLGGLLWFNHLGIIQVGSFFAPLYRVMGLAPQTSSAPSSPDKLVEADLDNDRFAKRIESQNIRTEELDKREADVKKKEDTNTQVAQELTDKQTELEEKEKTFNNEVKKYDIRKDNIEKIVQNLEGMQPKNAVNIMVQMDDQDIIDVLRRADEDAVAAGTSSMVAYWLSLMPPERAAEIQRKMANKPASIDE